MKSNDRLVKSYYLKWNSFLIFVFAFAICGLAIAFAQDTEPEAKVTKIIAETNDSIFLQASVSKSVFRRGDDIPINYLLENKGNRTVYLVVDPFTYVKVENLSVLRIVQPVSGVDDHLPYNYDLIKILPKKSYKGKLLIKAKNYLENKDYDFSITEIQVGFSYLFDKSNLEGCKQVTFVRPCLKELYDKSKSLTLGNLVIEIKKP